MLSHRCQQHPVIRQRTIRQRQRMMPHGSLRGNNAHRPPVPRPRHLPRRRLRGLIGHRTIPMREPMRSLTNITSQTHISHRQHQRGCAAHQQIVRLQIPMRPHQPVKNRHRIDHRLDDRTGIPPARQTIDQRATGQELLHLKKQTRSRISAPVGQEHQMLQHRIDSPRLCSLTDPQIIEKIQHIRRRRPPRPPILLDHPPHPCGILDHQHIRLPTSR